ncbi:hypothetical protein LSAT2_010331 [Lamellibrachia satsuma]|nr:hypothetical protein LSAT2_010331 [Lamellibrachia satsuma]
MATGQQLIASAEKANCKRLRQFVRQVQSENLQLLPPESAVCWQTRPPDIVSPLPSVLLEECDIPGVGWFTAHSSGHVRVIFPDRTCLDMYADFQKRIGICEQHSDTEVPTLTSNYAKYIKAAIDWSGWVNSSPSERYMYYKDSPYDPEKRASVDSELKKIRCFNYLVESQLGQPRTGPVIDAQDTHPPDRWVQITIDFPMKSKVKVC